VRALPHESMTVCACCAHRVGVSYLSECASTWTSTWAAQLGLFFTHTHSSRSWCVPNHIKFHLQQMWLGLGWLTHVLLQNGHLGHLEHMHEDLQHRHSVAHAYPCERWHRRLQHTAFFGDAVTQLQHPMLSCQLRLLLGRMVGMQRLLWRWDSISVPHCDNGCIMRRHSMSSHGNASVQHPMLSAELRVLVEFVVIMLTNVWRRNPDPHPIHQYNGILWRYCMSFHAISGMQHAMLPRQLRLYMVFMVWMLRLMWGRHANTEPGGFNICILWWHGVSCA
jgi:hypothetical protein